MAEMSAQEFVKSYTDSLEMGDTHRATEQLYQLALKLEKDSPPDSTATLKPSKAYRKMRALLRNPGALNLFFTRALALPRGTGELELSLLDFNLLSLRVMFKRGEFAALLLQNGFLEKIKPLLLHTADWLGTDRFLKGGAKERTVVGTLLKVVYAAANADVENGAAFINESGLLPKIREHLPWKEQPKLGQDSAKELSEILTYAQKLLLKSDCPACQESQLAEHFLMDGVVGWMQSVLLWAVTAAERSAHARAPLEKYIAGTFFVLDRCLQAMGPGESHIALSKLVLASRLAERLTHDVSIADDIVSASGAFLRSVARARTLQETAPQPAAAPNAGLERAEQRSSQSREAQPTEPVRQLTAEEGFADTRDPCDVIGADGEFVGSRNGDVLFSGRIDWGHVIRTLESGDPKSVERLLPTLAGFYVAAKAGDVSLARVAWPPKAWAESMVVLLESGQCRELWAKPGVLGSFFWNLHGAFKTQHVPAPGRSSQQEEEWFARLGCRILGWVYARAHRLCLQALSESCSLLSNILNLTWATKLLAVQDAHYLEFGFAVFQLLDRLATSTSPVANTQLATAAMKYLTTLLKEPVTQRTPLTPDDVRKWDALRTLCLQKGLLEWALKRCADGRSKSFPHRLLLSRIFLMASQNESGRGKYGTCPDALKTLVGEASCALEMALKTHRFRKSAPSLEEAAHTAHDVASCLESFTWLLVTCYGLVLEKSGAQAGAMWPRFRGAEGLLLVQKVLKEKETLEGPAGEYLDTTMRVEFGKALLCAEELWEKGAAEAGLKRCSNPRCTSVEVVKGQFQKCAACKGESYCGRTCQKAHWRQGHKLACRPVNGA